MLRYPKNGMLNSKKAVYMLTESKHYIALETDAKKQGNQHFYHNVEKAAVDRAGMERAALDYIARHRYGSARW